MKKTLTIILTAVVAIGIILASCESTTGPDEPQETTNEQEGLAAAVDAVANFFELDPTDRRSTDANLAIFLKLGEIPGESTDEEHKKWIDILGIELGRTVRVSRDPNGREAGDITFSDVVFTKTSDKSSPLLQKAADSDEVFPTAMLSIRKTGTNVQVENITITFEEVIVTSYQTGGSEKAQTEEITFSYSKVSF